MKVNGVEIEELDEEQSEIIHSEPEHYKASSIVKELLLYAMIFLLCVFVLPRYVVQKTIVDGDSMENTLYNADRLLIDKLSYHFSNPDRFDIVVFYPYGKDVDEYYVKRVIGLPGETVQIIDQDIYINGKILKENYGKEPITFAGIAEDPITLGEDEFFLLGDNREISLDSRYQEVGPVHRNMIAGHAILRIWPMDEFGIVK